MKTLDALIAKFKEAKEELSKNVNMSYGTGKPNMSANEKASPPDMQMAEKMEGGMQLGTPPAVGKHRWVKKANSEDMKLDKGGQWNIEKCTNREASPTEPHNKGSFKVMDEVKEKDMKHAGASGKPYDSHGEVNKAEDKGHSAFEMSHVHEISGMKDHGAAKQRAHAIVDASKANDVNRAKMKRMIDTSKNPRHLASGMSNHILAHPSEGLKTIK